jgi:hypothetical protein
VNGPEADGLAARARGEKRIEEKAMKQAKLWATVLSVMLLCGGMAFAQGGKKKGGAPAQNVSAKRHPNLAASQRLTAQAYAKIIAAQKANEWDMEGHAAKAKDLLDQANNELKQAAEAANKNAGKGKPAKDNWNAQQ